MKYTHSDLVKAKHKMTLKGLFAFYNPVRRKWIISNNLTTLLYGVLDCGVKGEYKLVGVSNTGHMSQGQNKWGTARWLEAPTIDAYSTKHIIKYAHERDRYDHLTLANRWYRVDGRHLIPMTDEEWDLR